MKLRKEKVIITKTIYVDGEFECDFHELIDILDNLQDYIFITDKDIADYLVKKGVAEWNVGFNKHGDADKFEQFYEDIYNL